MHTQDIQTHCCVAGGGPAGIMLGFLLARAGIPVTVLEKWPDFFRDFRGDTIHPSTLEALSELGLLDAFLSLPHNKTTVFSAEIGGKHISVADFSHLPVKSPYLAFIPQWDFLNFIAKEAQKLPHFQLLMGTEAVDLIEENNTIVGVKAKNSEGEFTIRATLVVGADGRHSTVREKSQLPLTEIGAPMDILWFSLSHKKGDPTGSVFRLDFGRMMIMIDRGDYWQCGFVIQKGYFEAMQKMPIEKFYADIEMIAPELRDRFNEIPTWDKIKLLQVSVNRLKKWHRPGLLCIGDAAHAMSPVGGVGINLAIQDAIATANILAPSLLNNTLSESDLAKVQKRREPPMIKTQRMQVLIQNHVIKGVLSNNGSHMKTPLFLKLLQHIPILRRIPAKFIGMGFLPEHIRNV